MSKQGRSPHFNDMCQGLGNIVSIASEGQRQWSQKVEGVQVDESSITSISVLFSYIRVLLTISHYTFHHLKPHTLHGTLALNILKSVDTNLLAHSAGESLVGNPLGGVSWGSLFHHTINLLEGKTLGLWHEEVSVDESAGTKTSPYEEDAGFEVSVLLADHVGGDDGNDGVPEPVGGGGETNTTGSDGEREDLADDDPCSWTPGGGEEEDEDGDEGNLSVDSASVVGTRKWVATIWVGNFVGVVKADGDTNNGDEELADQHAKSTPEKDETTSKSFDCVERDRSRADIDQCEDQRDQETVFDGAGGLQEGSGVVEDEVDTSPVV